MDPINATGLNFMYNGDLLNAVSSTLENTFLGIWVWLLLIIALDFIIFIKTRNGVLTATVNLLLVYLFSSSLPLTTFMFLVVPSSLALAGAIYVMFK